MTGSSVAVETPMNLSSRQKEILREFEELSEGDTNPESSDFFATVKGFWDSMKG
jgi:molecular chaperone DnaJ